MTVAKIACAIVSCATALMLVHIIPDLLSVKTRELFLKNKAEELDREMGLILTQEETGRHVRMQCVYHITAHWLGSGPFLVGTCHPRLLLFVYLFYICQISKLMIGLNSLQKAMLSWF
ncbi:hypothetical protein NC652_036574 [Populus alba x Populus x berolinensis]|nr:hypothetical protein NC652_036574 [Populus alba x Populus x berolinensis]